MSHRFEHRDRNGRPWLESTEKYVRGLIRRRYGEEREGWAVAQLLRGRVLDLGSTGQVRAVER